ncbi:alkaline phosphatase D family protein [Nitrospirillum pindoramense]|uniref:Alkaline phosphatase D n=1 Tax=Nitrospirillum amazonense TaxID=28077 RepID=A0A560GWZ5_9PROT|nr:alkaline phosphatase D family protein [Nitrospirillum amazonense]TWB38547.1 alkaline phosphatase D [Nitrospirillum amazonense]
MTVLSRRRALSLLLLGAAAPLALSARPVWAAAGAAFRHGVASGDPLADRVVLWTRVTPDAPSATTAVRLAWEVAADAAFQRPVRRGTVDATSARDFTAKVDVDGLKPGQDYWYRFTCGAATSPVGRTRTLPQGRVDSVVMAAVTCALYPNGYFNAYDHIAKLDRLDAVVELGDYIYEYGAKDDDYGMENGRRLGRIPEPPHDIVTLTDYRLRYAQYRRDPDLQAAHARAPWICVWDDHEVCNDTWAGGAENHHPEQGAFLTREAAAVRAYYEWMPIREPRVGQAAEEIQRAFQFGDLATLVMVETRLQARSRQLEWSVPGDLPMAVYEVAGDKSRRRVTDASVTAKVMAVVKAGGSAPAPYVLGPDEDAIRTFCADPERQMMGVRQEEWLAATLKASVAAGTPWQVLGNEVVMARTIAPKLEKAMGADGVARWLGGLPEAARAKLAPIVHMASFDIPYDLDGWDGYPAARERVYDAIKAAVVDGRAGNTVVLSGDSHAFWVNELRDAAGTTRVAAEFGASSITSPSPGEELGLPQLGDILKAQNSEVLLNDHTTKGYVLLTLTHEAAVADLVAVTIDAKPYQARTLGRWRVPATTAPGVERPQPV